MFISKELLLSCCQKLSLSLTDEQIDKFDLYALELVKYNERVNLTAITQPDDIVVKHFADSLAVPALFELKNGCRLADVGTGAGFPGVPILILRDDISLTLIDGVNKKLEFLRFLTSLLSLESEIVHIRAEDAGRSNVYRETFDCVTARAVAKINVLSELCLPLVKKGGVFISMKGEISAEERLSAPGALRKLSAELEDEKIYNLGGGERRIFIIKKISQILPKYPRNMAQISKKPL